MKPETRKRYTLLASVLLVGGLSLACFLFVPQEQRQYAMDRELVNSLYQGDLKRAMKLVEAGADPNTHVELLPSPLWGNWSSWQEFLAQMFHRAKPSPNPSPTAFMVVCGDETEFIRVGGKPHYQVLPEQLPLAEAMLRHGANVNARNEVSEITPLMCVSGWGSPDEIELLLEHGAPVDAQTHDGTTALYIAVVGGKTESVKMLLKYHANPNTRDSNTGDTPLDYALKYSKETPPEIVRLLKAAVH